MNSDHLSLLSSPYNSFRYVSLTNPFKRSIALVRQCKLDIKSSLGTMSTSELDIDLRKASMAWS